MSAIYFFEIVRVEKRAFLFLPKIWKHFVPGVDFQPNEDLHRNGRNHTLCSRVRCLPGHIALLWISTIWAKVSPKTWDPLWCCILLSIIREMCPLVSLPGKDLKMRCLHSGASHFVPNQDCTARSPLASFLLLKRYSFPCPRITLWKRITSELCLPVVLRNSAGSHRIPNYSLCNSQAKD